jgi:hypothetical protein
MPGRQRSPADTALNRVEYDPFSESTATITFGRGRARDRSVNNFREAKRRSPPRLRRSANSF